MCSLFAIIHAAGDTRAWQSEVWQLDGPLLVHHILFTSWLGKMWQQHPFVWVTLAVINMQHPVRFHLTVKVWVKMQHCVIHIPVHCVLVTRVMPPRTNWSKTLMSLFQHWKSHCNSNITWNVIWCKARKSCLGDKSSRFRQRTRPAVTEQLQGECTENIF